VALDAEVAAGRLRCDGGVYSIITEAFPRAVLAALLALTDEGTTAAVGNGKVECREQLAAEVAAMLAEEPFGLPCSVLAARLHRRLADVLAVLREHSCFVRSGRTRGVRWRLTVEAMASMGSGRNGKECEPFLGQALGHLMVNRLEAAERELAMLKAQLDEEEPAE
jgi:hypothetical protein